MTFNNTLAWEQWAKQSVHNSDTQIKLILKNTNHNTFSGTQLPKKKRCLGIQNQKETTHTHIHTKKTKWYKNRIENYSYIRCFLTKINIVTSCTITSCSKSFAQHQKMLALVESRSYNTMPLMDTLHANHCKQWATTIHTNTIV